MEKQGEHGGSPLPHVFFHAMTVGIGDHARQVRVYGQDTPVSVL